MSLSNDFLEANRQALLKVKRPYYREKAGIFNATDCFKDNRDLYWTALGEPKTSTTDAQGYIKMGMGDAYEDWYKQRILNNLALVSDFALIGGNVPISDTSPQAWNGYLDGLLVKKVKGQWKKIVLEIKTKSGWGATLLHQKRDISREYLGQLGMYLRKMSKVDGGTNEGILAYALLSDNHFGDMVTFSCRYDQETNTITAYETSTLYEGKTLKINQKLDLTEVDKRWAYVKECIATKTLPDIDYHYKYDLTTDSVREISVNILDKVIKGEKIHGDWQITYSNYKDKHIELAGGFQGHSLAEKQICAREINRRLKSGKSTKEHVVEILKQA